MNDTDGHAAGDAVHRHVAGLLRTIVEGDAVIVHLSKSDVVARYGGEEFAILLPDARSEGARIVAERVRSAVDDTVTILDGGISEHVTRSIVVTSVPEHACEPEKLVVAADSALYASKSAGRNRISCSGRE